MYAAGAERAERKQEAAARYNVPDALANTLGGSGDPETGELDDSTFDFAAVPPGGMAAFTLDYCKALTSMMGTSAIGLEVNIDLAEQAIASVGGDPGEATGIVTDNNGISKDTAVLTVVSGIHTCDAIASLYGSAEQYIAAVGSGNASMVRPAAEHLCPQYP
ncbi:hypothetical protein HQO42_05365 [Rhodococcus fascians]|nr:hypothetical protein [Rhodococcus fascians]MBY4236566.1 hypothetical protein [Rhodococcus fascians]MBY4252068.1 hypothetical protein [Rhodococcus fascians]MBY4267911.1 hypothetical protein [Rhodococcus fascians]